jgi:glycosyltransferase involved in cell wall biosynthesis
VLPTFVDSFAFDANHARRRQIVYVGRLSPEKGLDVLIDAYERVLRHGDQADVDLIVAGEGENSYVAGLAARAQRISPRAKFVGALNAEAVRTLLSSSLVSVVPSLCYENLPNVMLESFAAGTPVAASNLGSMAEVLAGTDAGFLFAPGNSEDLAGGLVALLRDPVASKRMGKSAKSLAEGRYGPEGHLAGLLNILNGAIERSSMP